MRASIRRDKPCVTMTRATPTTTTMSPARRVDDLARPGYCKPALTGAGAERLGTGHATWPRIKAKPRAGREKTHPPSRLIDARIAALGDWRGAARPSAAWFGCFAALLRLLPRRTWNGSEGAEHAAIAGRGPQHGAATLALIEELTGIGRHGFHLSIPAMRTCDRRLKLHHRSLDPCGRSVIEQHPPGSRPSSSRRSASERWWHCCRM